MRLNRLILDAAECTIVTDFHRRMTLVRGLEPAARSALAQRVAGAITDDRDGVHAEVTDGGRDLAVFRPAGAPHRVVDIDTQRDVTSDYVGDAGTVDLLLKSSRCGRSADPSIHVPRDRATALFALPPSLVSHARALAIAVAIAAVVSALAPKMPEASSLFSLTAAAAAVALALTTGREDAQSSPDTVDDRLAAARAGTGRLPLVIVDPFDAVDDTQKALLLDALSNAAAVSQLIVVTDDPTVLALAHFKAMHDELAIATPQLHRRALDDSISAP